MMETMQATLNIDPWLDLMVALAAAIMLVRQSPLVVTWHFSSFLTVSSSSYLAV